MPTQEAALAEAIELGDRAVSSGADVLTLPEYCGGLRTQGSAFRPPAAPETGHAVLTGLRHFARTRRTWMVVGSIAVQTSSGKVGNRSYVINDYGEIVARYDKLHMFDIQLSESEYYRESDTIEPGKKAILVDTPFGKLGMTICYDLRFPQLYRDLAQAGAEILLTPAAFTKKTGEAHWHVLNRARAIENGAFVVAPCAIGAVDGGGESYGHSLIISPWGEVLADGGTLPGIVQASINLAEVAAARARIPSLSHDRPYALLVASREAAA
jgi:predicted amidohydrolase